MSKRRKFTPEPERFVAIYGWEMDTPAYRLMSVYGRALLIEFRRLYNGSNNGKIGMSVRQAAESLACNKDTAAKALHELEAKGWIRLAAKGSFTYKARLATTWRLTNQPVGLGVDVPATKDYAHWRPDEKQKTVPRRRTNGPTSSHRSAEHGATSSDQTPPDGPTASDWEGAPRSHQTGHSVSTRGEAAVEASVPTADAVVIPASPAPASVTALTPTTIIAERKRLGWSQRHLARLAGTSNTLVYKIEKGDAQISAAVEAKLTTVLNISLEAIR